MKPEKLEKGLMKKLDLVTMTVPLIGIVVLCALFMIGAVHECAWKDPGIFGRRSGNLLCVDRSGSIDLQYVYGIFPLRENQAWKCGKTGIFRLQVGSDDLYVYNGGRYPVLFVM